ncbi:DUF4261 domain-containing protein [Clostridium folliculivorans]|uniref:DUF4261 domain-containing protein n=1 Tax=Clostridium folliculivorans TaxID=2886038 RepID=A0A9W5Y257_9CLOT|nr:DUF4261 domain-containing protein [Clostridium folliculivorans]GKU25211.1 hypothetical protein CFOLD11_20370 [Clostridium folliculivorans]GKU31309.1 hypothetical protein CFB3_34160 [Clostridium folliculivorans]
MFWKTKKNKKDEDTLPDCFARTYGVEIFTEKEPQIPVDEILRKLRWRCGNVELVANEDKLILFTFKDHVVQYSDGQGPAQIAVMITDKKIDMENLEMSFYQSWGWKDARSAVQKTAYTILVTDMMASGLDYTIRLELFQKTLYSLLEVVPCLAINWHLTQQIIDPENYKENAPENEDYNLMFGALNVRLFNIEGTENETLMDTIGLGALGLPDLQCHFKNIDVNKIANILYTYGDYIFKNGDVINDGETIEGLTVNDKWRCQHEISLLEPKRVVIDINPGEEFSAGNR